MKEQRLPLGISRRNENRFSPVHWNEYALTILQPANRSGRKFRSSCKCAKNVAMYTAKSNGKQERGAEEEMLSHPRACGEVKLRFGLRT
jgi:hypothetical protein